MEEQINKQILSLKRENEKIKKLVEERTNQLLSFFDITTRVLKSDDLDEQLTFIADGITSACLFRRAIISLFSSDFKRLDVGYSGLSELEIKEHHNKPSIPSSLWQEVLSERYRVSKSYFIPNGDDLNTKLGGIRSTQEERSLAGSWNPSDMLFIPLRSANGKLLGVISVDDPLDGDFPSIERLKVTELFAQEASEIIERSDLTRKFFKMQQYLMRLIESSTDVIVSSDFDGKIVIFNNGAEGILGYTPQEVIGKPITILYESEDEARKIMHLLKENDGKVQSIEVSARAKDGSTIPLSLSAALLYNEKGEVIGTEGISKDLRPYKALQRHIEELNRKETIRIVAVTLSHHINNYIQSMVICGQNIEEVINDSKIDFSDEKTRMDISEYLSDLKLNAMRISKLTKILVNPPEELSIDEYLDGIKMLQLPKNLGISFEVHHHEFCGIDGVCPKILVADDEMTIREGIADFLRAHGFLVDTAPDGAQAIKKIEKKSHDYLAVISDIKMPFANGYEVFRAAKKANPNLVVILMTAFGYDENHALVKASREGLKARLFKEKPFDMNNVLKVLRETIAEKY
ncbi:PAS domain S-box protein [bacterium]|nr:PAS domain S-box protein [bacterium]